MINKHNAKLVGSTLSSLYQKCWITTAASYKKLSQSNSEADKKAAILIAHHMYGCIFEALDKKIRSLKNAE